METRLVILARIRKLRSVTGRDLVAKLGISRQAVNAHLKTLIREGKVHKAGRTKGAVYKPGPARETGGGSVLFKKLYPTKRIKEDAAFDELSRGLRLGTSLNARVGDIYHYAFTEMLNNAIEHSHSPSCSVQSALTTYDANFVVRDWGIGIFHSIASKFRLPDENSAVGELLKGKTTTMKKRHTGEGIFFTSKAADRMTIRSHRIELVFDSIAGDVFVAQKRRIEGTEVTFAVSRNSRRKLPDVFAAYAPEDFDYQFQRTRVLVKLFQKDYVSRSEARRMLAGLDKFKEVILDFRGVKTIGQGFADEVFRVFQESHPGTKLITEDVSPALAPMIRHVVDNRK